MIQNLCKQIVSLLLGVDTLHAIQDFPEFFQAPTPIVVPLAPEPVNGIVGRLAEEHEMALVVDVLIVLLVKVKVMEI